LSFLFYLYRQEIRTTRTARCSADVASATIVQRTAQKKKSFTVVSLCGEYFFFGEFVVASATIVQGTAQILKSQPPTTFTVFSHCGENFFENLSFLLLLLCSARVLSH
jgi:ABC-type polysaccharide/polyol phosphate export permease